MPLTDTQIERYSRHILLRGVGGKGQERLLAGRVLIVGAGGLGSPAAMYLAAAGVGTLGIVDDDVVDISNLQRQVLHGTGDVGRLKVDSARETLEALNPDVSVQTHALRFDAAHALDLIADYDLIIDGTDNFDSKFLIADACHLGQKPYVHAGVLRYEGQLITVIPGQTTCYRCIFQSPPPTGAVPTCAEAGVLGVLPGVIGGLQATEALKFLLGQGDLLTDALLTYDALALSFRRVTVKRNPRCPLCGEHPQIKHLADTTAACTGEGAGDV